MGLHLQSRTSIKFNFSFGHNKSPSQTVSDSNWIPRSCKRNEIKWVSCIAVEYCKVVRKDEMLPLRDHGAQSRHHRSYSNYSWSRHSGRKLQIRWSQKQGALRDTSGKISVQEMEKWGVACSMRDDIADRVGCDIWETIENKAFPMLSNECILKD